MTGADIELKDGKLAIRVDQRRNHPDRWAGQVSQLKEGKAQEASTSMSLTVRSKHKWELRRSLVSDLKSAYLAAFAVFGYRYALDARLDPIREQIRHPEEELVEGAWWIAPPTIERDPTLILLRRPFPGVLVRMRDAMVFLPWTSSPDDFYQSVRAHFAQGTPADFGGTEYDWPMTLELEWDLWLCEQRREDQPPEAAS